MNPPSLLLRSLIVPMFAALFGTAARRVVRFSLRNSVACVALCMLLAGAFAPVAAAAEPVFSSPKGFTIAPPDGWTLMSKDGARDVSAAIKNQYPKFDVSYLNGMAVMLLNPTDGGATNLNVVVTPSRLPITDSGAEEKLAKMLRGEYTKVGVTIGRMAASRKTFGTHPAIVADFESNVGGSPTRQWQAVMVSGKQTLIVTCTSPQSTFEKFVPVFTKAIEGMTFPPDAGGDMPAWLKYGIIGGAIGGLIGGLQKLLSSRKK